MQVRAHGATASHGLGIPDTEEVTGSIPVPPTSSEGHGPTFDRSMALQLVGLHALSLAGQATSAAARVGGSSVS